MSPAGESDTVVFPFLPVPPLHNPIWIKSSRYLPAHFIQHTWWPYIPYLCWIVLSAAGSIVPGDIEKEAQAPSVIRCPAVSGFLQGTPGIFPFGKHYVWLPVCGRDMTGGRLPGQGDNCPLLEFPFLFFLFCFFFFKWEDLQLCVCVCVYVSKINVEISYTYLCFSIACMHYITS